ncbi:metal-dependent hydrolase [Halostella sp. JP-L12]|uniref:metal-dependent hydrolase n=1 Tax=Halostella TaxID=1843185 RepID=UPI000EF763E8|nr:MULTISPECIES: metal-dependent hydrolase [Halostella]NHN46513.1 metal-dependent hydrolase [Halostella sp. JP-L12]
MAELLTHALVGYSLGTILTIFDDRLRPAHVTLVMLGALVPDLVKMQDLVPATTVETLSGVPFAWFPLHTLAGTVLVVVLGALLIGPDQRRIGFGLLALGAISHHVLDLLLLTSSGYAYPIFWPLTGYYPPTGNLYLSTDRWPAVVAGSVAFVLWVGTRERGSTAGSSR